MRIWHSFHYKQKQRIDTDSGERKEITVEWETSILIRWNLKLLMATEVSLNSLIDLLMLRKTLYSITILCLQRMIKWISVTKRLLIDPCQRNSLNKTLSKSFLGQKTFKILPVLSIINIQRFKPIKFLSILQLTILSLSNNPCYSKLNQIKSQKLKNLLIMEILFPSNGDRLKTIDWLVYQIWIN